MAHWDHSALFAADSVGENFFFLNAATNSFLGNIVNITATANALTLGLASGAIIPNGDLQFLEDTGLNSIEFTVTNASPILTV
jgi:hypothetical protein